jgi:tryptophanase
VTNKTGGGQPVSIADIRAYAALLKRHGQPLTMDVCRLYLEGGIRGVRIVRQPKVLRHFTCECAWI